MGKKGHSEEESPRVLREAESGDAAMEGSASGRSICGRRSMQNLI